MGSANTLKYKYFIIFLIQQLFINNEWVKSTDGRTFKTENPTDGKVIAEVQQAGKADIDKAVKAAKDAFKLVFLILGSLAKLARQIQN